MAHSGNCLQCRTNESLSVNTVKQVSAGVGMQAGRSTCSHQGAVTLQLERDSKGRQLDDVISWVGVNTLVWVQSFCSVGCLLVMLGVHIVCISLASCEALTW